MNEDIVFWIVAIFGLLIFLATVIAGGASVISLGWALLSALTGKDDREVSKQKRPAYDDEDAGIRDLLEEGRDDEAVDIYQKFAGVDEFTARAMVERIKNEMDSE